MVAIAGFIKRALESIDNGPDLERVRLEVAAFCSQFPLHTPTVRREAA
jgi:glycine/serine hydroxymethyltransferase